MHKIPNLMFAKWGERNMIRIIFPGLYSDDRSSSHLTRDQQREFYELGLRPAMVDLEQGEAAEWAPTYEAELTRARKKTGHMAFQRKGFPRWNVPILGPTIRHHLARNNVIWAEGFQFLHNVRGTKQGTLHSMDAHSADMALDEFLLELSLSRETLLRGIWFIDVAIEFMSDDGGCLQWRTDSHFQVVKEVLEISTADADRITTIGSSKYHRDIASHLISVSGCRIEPGAHAEGPYEVQYLQMYTTDKSLTYNPEGGAHGKTLSCDNAMTLNHPFCFNLYNLYRDASRSNSSHARLEVRVPFVYATTILQQFSRQTLKNSLLKFTRLTWWSVKCFN